MNYWNLFLTTLSILLIIDTNKIVCHLENGDKNYGIQQHTVGNNKIGESYKIFITSQPNEMRLGEKFSLHCQVTPNIDNLLFQWSKDDKFISYGNVLNFQSFNKNDMGIYKCKATGISKNAVSVILETNSYQKICNFPHYNIELTPGIGPQIIIKPNQLKELHCEIDLYNKHKGYDVTWKFNGQLLNEDLLEKLGLTRYDRQWTSILVIQDANTNNDGQYTCQIENKKKSVKVHVLPKTGFVYVNPEKVQVDNGTKVEFHCRIDGIPNISNKNLKWTFLSKNGTKESLPNKKWKVSKPCNTPMTSFITANNVSIEDNGDYICTAPNGENSKGNLIVNQPKKSIKILVTPATLSVQKFQRFEFECIGSDSDKNPIGDLDVKFLNGSDVKNDSRFVITELKPSQLKIEAPYGLDISENELNITCGVENIKVPMNIKIKKICPSSQKSCKNGECIDSSLFCNGVKDCLDGSDEDTRLCYECDPIRLPCGVYNSTNYSTMQRFNVNWACDGDNDCVNGFDEQNCKTPDENCNTQIFTCDDQVKKPYSYVCDGNNDCANGEDEIGCMIPVIVNTSPSKMSAPIGSTVKMSCEAVGLPIPKIVWRYNWGCISDTPRITVNETISSCQKVTSVLTIKNFQSGDDAIYGCEAVGGKGRAFGTDFFLTVEL